MMQNAGFTPAPRMTARLSPSSPLTPLQIDVLAYLWEFFDANDQLPPKQAICANFHWTSLNTAVMHCDALERRGLLERNTVGRLKFTKAGRALVRR
jgi:DNA-binding MarR family transcriptional regulator